MRRPMRLDGVLRGAIDAHPRVKRPRRHSADVTADRLIDHAIEWDTWEPREREALSTVIDALREMGDGTRRTRRQETTTP